MRYLAALLGSMALLAVPARADPAHPYPGARGTNVAGPRLVWSENDGRIGAQDLAGGPPRTLYRGRLVGGADGLDVTDLEPGATRIAFVTMAIEEFSEGGTGAINWMTVRTGPLDGPFPIVAGRETDTGDPPLLDDVGLYEGGVVHVSHADRGDYEVTVRPDSGPARTLLRTPESLTLAAAGGVVAVRATIPDTRQTRMDVFDIASGQKLYGLEFPDVAEFTVAADGTLLVLETLGVLSWASPAAPSPHDFARRGLQLGGLANGTAVFSAASGDFAVVRAADLATGAVRDVTPPLSELLLGLGAWDGAHFAYHDGSCVIAGDLPAAPPATIPTGPGCPRPNMRTDSARGPHRGEVTVLARCPGGAAEHCTGTARLTGRIRGRTRVLASAPFDLTGGRQATIALTVKRSLLRRVGSRSDRRRHRHPARLEIRMTAGTVDTRSQTVTFRS